MQDTLWVGRNGRIEWKLLEGPDMDVESKQRLISSFAWGEKKFLALEKLYEDVKARHGKEIQRIPPKLVKKKRNNTN